MGENVDNPRDVHINEIEYFRRRFNGSARLVYPNLNGYQMGPAGPLRSVHLPLRVCCEQAHPMVAPVTQGKGAKELLVEDDSETIASFNRGFTPSPASLKFEPAMSTSGGAHNAEITEKE
tara:strand:+ start:98 stop:457 length:360 start_codon:yes stop_codon:yes gene_type:complete